MLALSIAAVLSMVVLSRPSHATLLAYEGFRISFPTYGTGGTGFAAAPWTGSGYTLRAKSLCFARLDASEGGSVAGEAVNASIQRTLAVPLGANDTTRYISFLIQPASKFDTVFSFFGLALFGSTGALFAGKPGALVPDQYVIEDFGTSDNQVVSGVRVVLGRTALLVIKLDFKAGQDAVTLYVDPTPGRSEPGSTAVKSNLDLGTVGALTFVSNGATSIIDEIRIGTTWWDVVPSGSKQSAPDFLGCLGD